MHFHNFFFYFQPIFLIFLDSQQARTNFMIPNNGIRRINSCKSNMDLGGWSYILDIFTDIDFKDDCLVFNCFLLLLEIYLNLFYICYWANLTSHKGALACYPGTLLLIYFFRTLWICMPLMTISIFDVILGCFDACLIVFDGNTYYVSCFQTNL